MDRSHAVAVTRQIREPNEWALSPERYADLIAGMEREFSELLRGREILTGPFTFMYSAGGIITVTKVSRTTNFDGEA